MAKNSLFRKNTNDNSDSLGNVEKVFEKREEEKYEFKKRKDVTIMDRDITKYIIEYFPSMAVDFKDSLVNLSTTLENIIDFIEDKANYVVKTDRDFKLSQSHTDKAIEVYDVVKKINDYVSWIDEEYENKIEDEENENLSENIATKDEKEEEETVEEKI